MWQVFKHFFFLGWISFGGPAAHLGYFQRHFVSKLGWLEQAHYAQLVALSQFLPGPGSSQVGFAIGYQRAGLLGGITAFVAFTLPSFFLMVVMASLNQQLTDNQVFQGLIHGLKLVAVVVVADAILTMGLQFWRSRLAMAIGFVTAIAVSGFPSVATQLIALCAAAGVGLFWRHQSQSAEAPFTWKSLQWVALAAFALLFLGLPLLASSHHLLSLVNDFYHAGSLVFGGGHVVLPMLQQSLTHQVSADTFLFGYASAQAIPGPMFTLASFLGYELGGDRPWLGAVLATFAIFLPGFLLLIGFMRSWQALAQQPKLAGAIAAVNTSVVGLLLSAWYSPVLTHSVQTWFDGLAALVGFVVLRQFKWPIYRLILGFSLLGLVMALL